MNFTLKVWRQEAPKSRGEFRKYEARNVAPDASLLEMLDVVNDELVIKGEEPIAFDHDCREGICGSCGAVINGRSHGPGRGAATCELRVRKFEEGETIVVEPWRAKAFPVLKDLVVDRTALDRIMQAGGYTSAKTGGVPDGNAVLIPRAIAEEAMDAAACIGCGACVASCPNSSAMLFVSAKVSQLALLPQGKAEARRRVMNMLAQMDKEGFGACSNTYACEAECPKKISVDHIARLNREFVKACIF
jgi:succinate dehydrogenase / fumarate reductase iron-sulfur subunit